MSASRDNTEPIETRSSDGAAVQPEPQDNTFEAALERAFPYSKKEILAAHQKAVDAAYKKGVADELECIETSAEHSEAITKLIDAALISELEKLKEYETNAQWVIEREEPKGWDKTVIRVEHIDQSINRIKESR